MDKRGKERLDRARKGVRAPLGSAAKVTQPRNDECGILTGEVRETRQTVIHEDHVWVHEDAHIVGCQCHAYVIRCSESRISFQLHDSRASRTSNVWPTVLRAAIDDDQLREL